MTTTMDLGLAALVSDHGAGNMLTAVSVTVAASALGMARGPRNEFGETPTEERARMRLLKEQNNMRAVREFLATGRLRPAPAPETRAPETRAEMHARHDREWGERGSRFIVGPSGTCIDTGDAQSPMASRHARERETLPRFIVDSSGGCVETP